MDNEFINLIQKELERVKNKKPINSFHESYGLIAEEVDEYWDEVKKKKSARDKENAAQELVQIATLCLRSFYDLKLNDIKL